MKLQVTQQNLAKALNMVARVASGRATLPILSNVLIKTNKNRLNLSATNLDIAITQTVGSKVEKEGALTVPARLMQDFVNNLPDAVIKLETKDDKLYIWADRYQSVINGVAADDFPVMPDIKNGITWKTKTGELKKGLQKIVFAASADDSRPVLTGVLFHVVDNKTIIASTDSYRLAEYKYPTAKTDVNFLLPHTAANDLLRIMTDEAQALTITHDDQQVSFATGDTILVARLIEGSYPDYQKLIPKKFETAVRLSRAEFMNITKVSSLFARESAGSVTISAEADKVSINAIASQVGENTASADAQVKGGGEVTLNSRYLIEALNVFEGEQIEFCFNGKLEPCILRSHDDPHYLHLIMPLRS
ncbi:TPA: DNA polymerase III subunit beta [Candidatus Saccharibacteria bacterium]|nr:MAG: polymerase III, beta subunit protein [Candidatus Saccharibacteria bacterium GW2011_GWA2_46_10]OGL36383.1 MAG: DNA polymerase III subunit beta [Candidatus Saccharibacteria bacterium RIFCSPHIGHO2_12_FULL_47_17]HCM52282.1 DNA polymerase III subunit beta [Candidatus Saccharibacteria bacterium]